MIKTPAFTLLYNNKSATADIAKDLIEAVFTDHLTGEADELDITLADPDRKWLGEVLADSKVRAENYTKALRAKLGRDVVPSQIIDEVSSTDIWQVKVIEPAEPIILQAFEWANCTDIQVQLGAIQNG